MKDDLPQQPDDKEIVKRYIKSIDKGLLKVMSKMGISTYQSYCGAQIFEAVGLKSDFVETFFTGTATRIEGVSLDEIANETVRRHRDAFGDSPLYRDALDVGGDYAYRVRGEAHVWTAATVAALQHAVRGQFARPVPRLCQGLNEQSERLLTIRGLFRIKAATRTAAPRCRSMRSSRPRRLCRRFATGAMSLGSISPRGAHDARHRHEPHRRQVEHRRGRRGSGPVQAAAQRRFDALRHQAGGVRAVRRHGRVSRQLPT